mgnify:CR=1 FL=1
MNLYLITRNDDGDYDQYDSAVVAAPDEEAAKDLIERNSDYWTNSIWTREGGAYKEEHTKLDITIELIGTAKADMPLGVVVASFNAG